MSLSRPSVGVLGAGAIGTYAGVRLSAAGCRVVLVGRQRLVDAKETLAAVDLKGRKHTPGADLEVATAPAALEGVDYCLLAVKGRDTVEATRSLQGVLAPTTPIVSLQNGLRNPDRIAAEWSGPVIPGVVAPNVTLDADYVAHQATKGDFFVGEGARSLAEAAANDGFALIARADVRDIAAGKLLMNLGNGVGAALGLGWAELLADPDARWCFAACVREGLTVMKRAGLTPKGAVGLPPGLVARALTWPDWVIGPVAKKMAGATAGSRSSTLQDLDRGKKTEIDDLNGEIVALAGAAPVNAAITELVHSHEEAAAAGRPPEFPAPDALRRRLNDTASI